MVVEVLGSDLFCWGVPLDYTLIACAPCRGAILNWGARQPTVVAVLLRFFFPRFLFPLWVRFFFLGGLMAQEESGCKDFTASVGVGEEFCGFMIWGLLIFVLLLLGFRFPRFFVTPMGRFLGQDRRLHLD